MATAEYIARLAARKQERVDAGLHGFRRRGTAEQNLRAAASKFVRVAVENGFLVNPTTCACVDCGAQARLHDHRDYSRPLDVEPVCRQCNGRRSAGFMPARIADPLPTKAKNPLPESRLRDLRMRAGVSVAELALLAGVSKAAISAYENGRNEVPVDRARKMLALFATRGVTSTLHWFYLGEESLANEVRAA